MLQNFLEQAIKHVPFYRGIELSSGNAFRNLEKFPIIEKAIIQEDPVQFQNAVIPRNSTYYVTTGGSSGNPLGFYLDNNTFAKEWAFVMTAWKRAGYTPGDTLVSFRGVEFKHADKGVFWQDNPFYNTVEMSPYHMSEENLPGYIKKITECKPRFLHGYPSAISILARYLEGKQMSFPPIKAVFAVSENIYSWQRELIERVFHTRLFSFYGMSEKVIMAPECEVSCRYHAFPEYGITEIIREDGSSAGEGETGELVGTGFLNQYMPFIRYRTGDFARCCEQTCECGRNHILFDNLKGRWLQEMIIGKNSSQISVTALNLHSDVLAHVQQFQFYQRKPGELIIRIIPKQNYGMADEKLIVDAIQNKVGHELDVNIEIIDRIQLTERGKHRMLVQNFEKE